MVKFQKQLEAQLVAEWRNAYVNYKQLKKDIKQIRHHIASREQHPVTNTAAFNKHSPSSSLIIHHCKADKNGGGGKEMVYETELVCGQVQWTEYDRVFFSRLDSQLNMVDKFYRAKEKEYLVRGKQLQVQLETLIDTKRALATEDGESDGGYRGKGSKNNDAFGVSRPKVGHAEKMLRAAFTEYYKALTLLQNYSSLNTLAFAKILKKYDKVTGKSVMDIYLREVQSSSFSTSSDKVLSMLEKVENLFTTHFCKNNKRQAMNSLRPSPHQNSNRKIFSLGLFTGCSWGLILALVLAVCQPHIASYVISKSFITSVLPILSTSILIPFHIYMYGLNVYFWTRTRINYAFIFEFEPGTELRSLEVVTISTGLFTIAVTSIVAHLLLFPMGKIIPITIFMVILLFVFLPFDICYRSARFYFIQCLWRILCAPLYKVEFADFFLADQFTSQITSFRSLGYISSYHASHIFHSNPDNSVCSSPFIHFQYIIAVLPYWWRLMQCVRRWVDEKDLAQIANGGKYLSALIAVLIRLKFETSGTNLFLVLFMISSSIATIYQFYWDVVMDWGLLQRKSVNPWLRDQLILKNKRTYFISMVVNAVLRLAWLYSIIHVVMPCGPTYQKYIDFILGMAEIARRGLWNFFRLENEHLNNVGKFRAVKTVPLPFKDSDQDT
ncbi:hypothetical protein SUGI_0529160 [Cryptomeria japonica]|uniref:phosphate transporter PHO1-3 isoform X2 n=1 Tax=Cryptomeria japonica TaxID=3369 RepID=UPI002408D1AE|nr:phosphate transporter PHO1-3 isoform X2 [Cryptomeria japonica]GLJ27005.1 hypothetical protein SUGI_0529160 [Cryptomeria japonica]